MGQRITVYNCDGGNLLSVSVLTTHTKEKITM